MTRKEVKALTAEFQLIYIEEIREQQKSPFCNHHKSKCLGQEPLMDARISGEKWMKTDYFEGSICFPIRYLLINYRGRQNFNYGNLRTKHYCD